MANNLLIAVVGIAGSGKSASLEKIPDQKSWLYLNCENGKPLPFKHSFNERVVTNPSQLRKLVHAGATNDKCKGIIIDTLTSAFDMKEMNAKKTAEDGFKAWDQYRDYILDLFQNEIANCNKPVIILCHVELTKDIKGRSKLAISVKGSMSTRGVESFLTNIVYADYVELDDLEEYKNDMLTITEDEKIDDGKYVFQTRKTASGVGLNIRQTKGLWERNETFIDNNIMHVINKITKFYGE